MALNLYTTQVFSDDGNTYNNIPANVILPPEANKYLAMPWLPHYTPRFVADLVYGDAQLWWLVYLANNYIDPFIDLSFTDIKVLLPDFLNEVVIDG